MASTAENCIRHNRCDTLIGIPSLTCRTRIILWLLQSILLLLFSVSRLRSTTKQEPNEGSTRHIRAYYRRKMAVLDTLKKSLLLLTAIVISHLRGHTKLGTELCDVQVCRQLLEKNLKTAWNGLNTGLGRCLTTNEDLTLHKESIWPSLCPYAYPFFISKTLVLKSEQTTIHESGSLN